VGERAKLEIDKDEAAQASLDLHLTRGSDRQPPLVCFAFDPLDARERQRHPCAQPRLWDAGDVGPRPGTGIGLYVPGELSLPRKDTGRDGSGDWDTAWREPERACSGCRCAAHRRQHAPRRPRRYVLLHLDRGPSPGRGGSILELSRESLEEAARVELRRHRASLRRDGADDAAQDLGFRRAVIVRPY